MDPPVLVVFVGSIQAEHKFLSLLVIKLESLSELWCQLRHKQTSQPLICFQGCGLPRRPGVYTKLSHYVQWIEDTIRSDGQDAMTCRNMDESQP